MTIVYLIYALIEIVDMAYSRGLGSHSHNLQSLVQIIRPNLHLRIINPHIRQFIDTLIPHSRSLLHDLSRSLQVPALLIKLCKARPQMSKSSLRLFGINRFNGLSISIDDLGFIFSP